MSISSKQSGKDVPDKVMPLADRQDWRSFMQAQIDLPESDQRWKGMCESLQRQSHSFPARFASAYAHMIATPKKERLDVREAPVGAFIFVDDPRDSNAYGHIVGKWSYSDDAESIRVVSNDVNDTKSGYDPGNVTVCPLGWFPRFWGDSIRFATVWFGGDRIDTKLRPAAQPPRVKTAAEVRRAIDAALEVIEWMQKAAKDNDGKQHPAHEKAIRREIADQRKTINRLKKLLP